MSGADYRERDPEKEALGDVVRERAIAVMDELGLKGGRFNNAAGYYHSSVLGWPILSAVMKKNLTKDKVTEIDETVKEVLKQKGLIGGKRRKTRKGGKRHHRKTKRLLS